MLLDAVSALMINKKYLMYLKRIFNNIFMMRCLREKERKFQWKNFDMKTFLKTVLYRLLMKNVADKQ